MRYREGRYPLLPVAFLSMVMVTAPGCSSWPWKSGTRDAERLTRVIHAENARLKDVVVQLRSSNEDMAQRALDDASRIARLEEENERFRTSVAAYQSERERMARSFQTLQEQVRLALGDRSDILTTAYIGGTAANSADRKTARDPVPPPEGQIGASGAFLELSLSEWFAGDSALIVEGAEPRLARLGLWLSTRLPQQGVVRFASGTLNSAGDSEFRKYEGTISADDLAEVARNRFDLDKVRVRRLWEALLKHLPADKITNFQVESDPVSAGDPSYPGSAPRMILPIRTGS